MEKALSPLIRMTAMPPAPRGVETAAIVCDLVIKIPFLYLQNKPHKMICAVIFV